MAKQNELELLRKRLGIKKLKNKISITEFEKAVVKNLRIREMHRLVVKVKQHA